MLVLSRKPNQSICIGNNIHITVVRIRGNTVQLGIDAPKDVHVVRSELLEREASADRASKPSNVAEPASLPIQTAKISEDGVGHVPNSHAPDIQLMPMSSDTLARLPNLSIVH